MGAGFRYVYNASTNKTNRPLDAIEASYPAWRGNVSLDAGFVAAPSDLQLAPTSAAVDRGAALTTITSALIFFVAFVAFVSLGPGGHHVAKDMDARMVDAIGWVRGN